jgi:hypothetical protein
MVIKSEPSLDTAGSDSTEAQDVANLRNQPKAIWTSPDFSPSQRAAEHAAA